MNTLQNTKVSTLVGGILLVAAILPITFYTFMLKVEDGKLHNGPDKSPQFIVRAK